MRKSWIGNIRNKLGGNGDKKSEKSGSNGSLAPNNPFADPPPPAYSEEAPADASSSSSQPQITNGEDKYAFLSCFDTIFLLDDSGSMHGPLWKELEAILSLIVPICAARDEDGVDTHFLNQKSGRHPGVKNKAEGGYYGLKSLRQVQEVFRQAHPGGLTPTGERLEDILKPYVESLDPATNTPKDIQNVKPINIIVITDGEPTDDPERIIVKYAQKLDALGSPSHQVGIQFFQIGTDAKATEALQELDDMSTKQKIRDMVDTSTWDGKTSAKEYKLTTEGIQKVVLGGGCSPLGQKNISEPVEILSLEGCFWEIAI